VLESAYGGAAAALVDGVQGTCAGLLLCGIQAAQYGSQHAIQVIMLQLLLLLLRRLYFTCTRERIGLLSAAVVQEQRQHPQTLRRHTGGVVCNHHQVRTWLLRAAGRRAHQRRDNDVGNSVQCPLRSS
jgi:5-methylcytosine-specific restriction endonuclease McrA